jgi:tetratricopeptide (TPR) repeat protein/TolB-like protein
MATGLVLAAAVALGISAATVARHKPAPHHAVAVLGFRNVGGNAENAWLSTALAEMLNTELSGVPSLRVAAGEEVARMKGDLALSEQETLSKDMLLRVGRNLGSDVVVLGSYQLAPGPSGQPSLRLDLKALDTALGDTLVAVDMTGPSEELLELVERAGSRLRASITNTSPGNAPALRNILPRNPRAAQLYTTGLERLRAFDPLQATGLLQQAANLEPAHPVIHRELANAWRMLGYDEMALREAQQAFDLSAGLPPGERLLAEARLRQLQRDWEPALTLLRKARDLDPDNLDLALRLMHAQTSSSRPAEALVTLQALQQLPQAATDPRVDLAEADAADSLGDFKRSLEAARRAGATAERSGARLLLASARLQEANALRSLGEPDAAIHAATAARQAFEDAGDNRDAAEAVNLLGNVRLSQGRLPEARALYQQALTTMEAIGNKRGQGVVVNNLGLLLDQQGNHKESARMSERALRIAEETGDPMVMALALQNVANQLLTLGDLDGARANYARAAALDTSMGNAPGAAMTRTNLASVLYTQGALREAAQVYAEVEKTFEEAHNPSNRALALAGRADVLTLQGNFAEARALYAAAADLRAGLHEKGNVAQTRESLAQLELWQDHGEAAAALLTDILPVFQEEDMVEDGVFSRLFLVEALLLQGKVPQARQAFGEARTQLRRENLGPQVDTAADVADALLKAAQGRHADARRILQKQLAQAQARGQRVVAWDIRFRLLEVEAQRSRGPAFRKLAAAVALEARAAGMGATAARIQSRWPQDP